MLRQLTLIAILYLCCKSSLYSQQSNPLISSDTDVTIYTAVELMPEFPGGETERLNFIRENTQYPLEARNSEIQGTVYVTFTVEKDGSINNIRILKGIGGGCNEEAIRIISQMPNWTPGYQRGKAVRVQFNTAIKFSIGTKVGNQYNPNNNTSFYDGVANLDNGNYNKAIENFTKVLEEGSELANESIANIAICKINLKDYSGAADMLDRIRGMNKQSFQIIVADIYLKLANKYFDKGQYAQSITYYSYAIAESPLNIDLFYNRGLAFHNTGEDEKACNDWHHIKSLNLPDADKFLKKYCE